VFPLSSGELPETPLLRGVRGCVDRLEYISEFIIIMPQKYLFPKNLPLKLGRGRGRFLFMA
jgi:hypothetical protein